MAHFRKLLVPVDGSPSSCAALAQAVALADDLGATLDVIHIQAPGAARDADRTLLSAITAAKVCLGERVTQRTATGDPLREILSAAANDEVDLVVMGTHGRIGRLHAILGSTAEAVVHNSPRPVLTVREPDGEAESFSERVHGRPGIAEQKPSSR